MRYKMFYFFSCFLFISIACTRQPAVVNETTRVYEEFKYPSIQQKGKTLADFTPAFWSAHDTIYEDLNGDGKIDALLLLTYNDTLDVFKHPDGVMSYQLFEQRVLLILYKSNHGYILNTYCYKLLNFNGGMGRGGLIMEPKRNSFNLTFEIAANGMYYLHYTFEPEIKTGRWILTKAEEEAGNADYNMEASYSFKNDSLHYHSLHLNNDENNTTWISYRSDLDTIIHTEKYYYLDSIENGDSSPSNYLPGDFFSAR